MKYSTRFLVVLTFSLFHLNVFSQIVDPGWGCSYGDNMNTTDVLKNGNSFEYDMYINFIRCIDNKFTEKGADYNSIPSSVYADVWVTNLTLTGFKPSAFILNNDVYVKQFENAFKEHWTLPNSFKLSPYETSSLQFVINIHDTNGAIMLSGPPVSFSEMSFPQYFIIAENPNPVSVKSDDDWTYKVANAKYMAASGFVLPEPDALNLYFYTKKGERTNAFKTPVTPIPTAGGTWFSFIYPGKNIHADYDAGYFNVGDAAVVVKSAKSYPIQVKINSTPNISLRTLVTFVNVSEKIYQMAP